MKLKYLAKHIDERYVDEETQLLSVSKIKGVVPRSEVSDNQGRAEDISHYKTCKPNDLVINRMAAYQGALGIAKQFGAISPDYMVLRFNGSMDPRYVGYLFKSAYMANEMSSRVKGIGSIESGSVRTPRLSWSDLGEVDVSVPPIDEQKAIADFLDQEVARLDVLIEKQNQLCRILRERLAARIRQVTKMDARTTDGLAITSNSHVSLPNDWKTAQLGTLVALGSGNSIDSADIEINGSYPVYGANGFRGFAEKTNLNLEVLLIGRVGALCGNVHHVMGPMWVTEHALTAKARQKFDFIWLKFALRSLNLGQYATITAQPVIAAGVISKVRLPVPPLAQQVEIGRQLNDQAEKVEALISTVTHSIEILLERRMSLVSAAVTGKIDIRGKI
jgi:type I restriction enzyme S subunit